MPIIACFMCVTLSNGPERIKLYGPADWICTPRESPLYTRFSVGGLPVLSIVAKFRC